MLLLIVIVGVIVLELTLLHKCYKKTNNNYIIHVTQSSLLCFTYNFQVYITPLLFHV